jgi:hypothetical protein
MEHLATLGQFFQGFGLFMGSLGLMWFCSLYQKRHSIK